MVTNPVLDIDLVTTGVFATWPSAHVRCSVRFSMLTHMMELHVWCTNRTLTPRLSQLFAIRCRWLLLGWAVAGYGDVLERRWQTDPL